MARAPFQGETATSEARVLAPLKAPARIRSKAPGTPESDLLLRELVHRVKNSLTIISSIANLEAQSIQDPAAQESVQRLRSRVTATALLYDRLSVGSGRDTIRLNAYLGDLGTLLVESLALEPSRIHLELDVEALSLSPKIAGALGLIVNEAITNSFKYGLKEADEGRITVSCRRQGRGRCRLLVSDNGPGFPPGILAGEGLDFGFTLMALEAEELGGRLELVPGPGAAISVAFPLSPRVQRN